MCKAATMAMAKNGGLVALVALFLPGFLLLTAVLPLWTRLVRHPRAARAIAGANAAVVALLAAAFLDPVLREGVRSPLDAVVLASAGKMRLDAPDHVFVLGLAEGEFPCAPSSGKKARMPLGKNHWRATWPWGRSHVSRVAMACCS